MLYFLKATILWVFRMVKIRNLFGDRYKGRQGGAVYQGRYGKQIRRTWNDRKKNRSPAQEEQKARFRQAHAWVRTLSTEEIEGLKRFTAEHYPNLTWQQYAIKTALDRGKVSITTHEHVETQEVYKGDWDLEGWEWRQTITVSNSNSEDLNDYQVRLELDSTKVGDHFRWDLEGADLRFFDDQGTKLPYYVETWDEENRKATVWVRVSQVPAQGSTSIKMYYGNEQAESESNAKEVFDWYDDVNTFDINNYDVYDASVTVDKANGYVSIKASNAGYGIIVKNLEITDGIVEGELQILYYNGDRWGGLLARWQNEGNCYGLQCKIDTTGENPVIEKWVNGSRSQACGRGSGISDEHWVIYKFTLHGNTLTRWDSKSQTTCSVTWSNFSSGRVGIGCGGTGGNQKGETRFRWWRVRKYAATEPSAEFGTEEYGKVEIGVKVTTTTVTVSHSGLEAVEVYDDQGNLLTREDGLSNVAEGKITQMHAVRFTLSEPQPIGRVVYWSISGVRNEWTAGGT